jgi:6-phosphogluconolactonase
MIERQILTCRDAAELSERAAEEFVRLARQAIQTAGRFTVALSGGSTPKALYARLALPAYAEQIPWHRVHLFWGDERSVPPDHPDSNFGLAYAMFISQLRGVRADRVHRMPAEAADLDVAALAYESELRLAFDTRADELPAFDFVWLGIGPDGHTASLFPGSAALDVVDRWVVANWAPALETWRMTLTFPVINAARAVVIGAYGANKADALRAIRGGGSDLPASRVTGDDVEWIIDAAAAGDETAA